MKYLAALFAVSLVAGTPVLAQEQPQKSAQEKKEEPQQPRDGALDKAGKIATQPGRDLGLDKDEIPPVLVKAVENPYAAPPSRNCKGLATSMDELNAVLGPDFTVGRKANEGRAGKIAEAVGRAVVNSIIPFRGLVREISGAAPAERRLQAAVTAGIARRGYLRGIAAAKGCKIKS